jgi:hypothetical protein
VDVGVPIDQQRDLPRQNVLAPARFSRRALLRSNQNRNDFEVQATRRRVGVTRA